MQPHAWYQSAWQASGVDHCAYHLRHPHHHPDLPQLLRQPPAGIARSRQNRRRRHAGHLPLHPPADLHPQFCGGADLAVHLRMERLPVRGGADGQPSHGPSRSRSTIWQAVRSFRGTCKWLVRSLPPCPPCWFTSSWDVTSCAACWRGRSRGSG
ncbi:MAG: hypothetical protein MZV64_60520 [Ignavibacteriales bacterium]|nr:hypothetical protein [Ignavibacteriales bacterium]